MINGWFIGSFKPTVYLTKEVEVAVKRYNKGDVDLKHYHKIATELTVVISGSIMMNGIIYEEDDIIVINPGDETDFMAITDAVNVVVKMPGELNDKYVCRN